MQIKKKADSHCSDQPDSRNVYLQHEHSYWSVLNVDFAHTHTNICPMSNMECVT